MSEDDLRLMRRVYELYLAMPFYGSRRMVATLRRNGWAMNRKRARRLMRLMRIEAIYRKPNTSWHHPEHRVYPDFFMGWRNGLENLHCTIREFLPVRRR